jgi:hypothetical protein
MSDMRRLERIVGGILAIIALLAIVDAVCPAVYEFRCYRPLPAYRLWQGCAVFCWCEVWPR